MRFTVRQPSERDAVTGVERFSDSGCPALYDDEGRLVALLTTNDTRTIDALEQVGLSVNEGGVMTDRQWKQGDSLVFRPTDNDPIERSGQWWSEEPTCGVAVFGWADGRRYWVAHRNIRPETDEERHQREHNGYYAEQLR